jgi:methyl-accepting chemotaxis protein
LKAGFIANLRISRKLILLSAVFLVGFLAFGAYSLYTISTIKVNGPAYRQIILHKDLVADILPPPEYIIETFLTTLRLRDAKSPADVETFVAKIEQLHKDYEDRHAYWVAHLSEGTLKDTMVKEAYDSASGYFDLLEKELIPAVRSGDTGQAASIIDDKLTPLYESHRGSIDKVVVMANKESQSIEANVASLEGRSTWLLYGVAGVILVLSLLLCLVIALGITGPVRSSVAFARKIADGDLTDQLDIAQKDEIGNLAQALNGMSGRLRAMVGTIRESSEQVAASSTQITGQAQRLAEGAQSQASTLEESSAAVEELTASVDQVAEHAQSQAAAVERGSVLMTRIHTSIEEVSRHLEEIAALASESVQKAEEGARAVLQVVDGIGVIAESSEKIGGIVTVISDIAHQTNLLALNAAIEAARAGEHGRGFAVVADEVGKLADRSSSSTKEIAGLIKDSVKNVGRGVETAQGSRGAMEQIRASSQQVKDMIASLSASMREQMTAMKELSTAVGSVNEMSQGISAATEEQTTNAKQVSKALESVNELTQAASTSAGEMSIGTEQLAGMAKQLQALVGQFKLARADTTAPAVGAPSSRGGLVRRGEPASVVRG